MHTLHLLQGTVIHGQQIGRQLGFPTANLCVEELQEPLPQPGVYAAWATLPDGKTYRAMVNVGYRPTVDSSHHRLSVEAYLDQFSGDLYGQRLSLRLVLLLRQERRMASLDQLREQLSADLQAVREKI